MYATKIPKIYFTASVEVFMLDKNVRFIYFMEMITRKKIAVEFSIERTYYCISDKYSSIRRIIFLISLDVIYFRLTRSAGIFIKMWGFCIFYFISTLKL